MGLTEIRLTVEQEKRKRKGALPENDTRKEQLQEELKKRSGEQEPTPQPKPEGEQSSVTPIPLPE